MKTAKGNFPNIEMNKTPSIFRILLVEDNKHDRLAFRRASEKSQISCEITECARAEEVLECLRADASSFDLLVIDHDLLGMFGIDLFKELVNEDAPWALVLLAGVGSEQLDLEAFSTVVDDYLVKDPGRGYLELLPVVLPNAVQKRADRLARKKVEEELKANNRQLEETLAELRQMQRQVIQQERLRALGQMASSITHDFGNALTPILGYTELMLTAPGMLNDKEKVKHYLELINLTAKDVADIISNLRNFYRQRAENDIFTPVNPTRLVKQAVEQTRPRWEDQVQANGITINIKMNLQEVPLINGNETELQKALTNLIFNAVDAMPENGTITIGAVHDDENVILEISDTGVGMTEEVKQYCFEPFFSTKDERGAGLGLSMVHGIIRRHEGTIEIDSEEDRGTNFTIRLPIQKEAQERQETEATIRPLHVLLVEDRPIVRDVIIEYLLVDGHTVETAINGRDGLEKFHEATFDVVITDRAMPDMNGDKLAAAIKQIAPKQPVIMLTGFGDMMKYVGEIPEGVDILLSKPITLNDFRDALAKAAAKENSSGEFCSQLGRREA